MRISVEEQARSFLRTAKREERRVFAKEDVKKSLREYLGSIGLMFSPTDNIYVLKKSSEPKGIAIKANLFPILSLLDGVFTGDIVPLATLGKQKPIKEFTLITQSKNGFLYLGDRNEYKITLRKSTIRRDYQSIEYIGATLKIEDPLSYICNHISKKSEDSLFQEFVLSLEFERYDIQVALLNNYKLAGLSKLAIFYKNHQRNGQYLIIKNTIEES